MSNEPERDNGQEKLDVVNEIKAGDSRRLQAPSPLQAVADAPESEPLTLDEINEIIHEKRRKRSQK